MTQERGILAKVKDKALNVRENHITRMRLYSQDVNLLTKNDLAFLSGEISFQEYKSRKVSEEEH